MSNEIDNKVVSLEFDNSKFDKPAEESMSTLDKLKASFNFHGVSKGFDSLNSAIKKVTFAPIEAGIDQVYAKFTFMERFTIQMYDRMANAIINTGKRIVSETFVTPVKTGKSEYELKMGSIQTIMASTGETLDTVNEKLNELNQYADETIYSFSDMTTNIGKFTNAGVDLERAVLAIKGVSNEAAVSGANAAEASRAMYNFGQALSAGYVKLIDWKSIENANMATVEFKNQLIETAKELGTLTDAGNGFYKTAKGKMVSATLGFNDSLQDAWMSSEVLITTLGKYASKETEIGKKATAAATEVKTLTMMISTLKEALQTGWADTWEHIIGNFEEAKQLWTSVSNTLGALIGRMAAARNEMFKTWKDAGGRTALIEAMAQAWRNLAAILGAIKEAWRDVFPAMTGRRLAQITKGFMDLTRALKPSQATLINIKRSFAGLFSILGIIKDAFVAFKNAMLPVFAKVLPSGVNTLLKGTATLGDMIVNLRQTIKEGKIFEKVFSKIAYIFEVFINTGKRLFRFFKDIIEAFRVDGFTGMFKAIKDGFVDMVKSIWNFITSLKIVQKIKEFGIKIADAIGAWPILNKIKEIIISIKDWLKDSAVVKFVVGVFDDLRELVQKAIDKFRGVKTDAVGEVAENVKEEFKPLNRVAQFFSKIWDGIVKVFETVIPIVKNVGGKLIDAVSAVFSGIANLFRNSDLGDVGLLFAGGSLGAILLSISNFLVQFSRAFNSGGKFINRSLKLLRALTNVLRSMTVLISAKAILEIAKAVAILAASLFVMALIPADELTRATAAIMFLMHGLTTTMESFSKTQVSGLSSGAGAAGVILSMGGQLLAIAAAVGILVANIAILALIPYEAMVKGIAVLLLLLRALTREFSVLRNDGGMDVKMASTIIAFGLALSAIVNALSLLALVGKITGPDILNTAALILSGFIIGMAIVITKLSQLGDAKPPIAAFLAVVPFILAITAAIILISAEFAIIAGLGGLRVFSYAAAAIFVMVGAVALIMAMVGGLAEKTKSENINGKAVVSMAALFGIIAASLMMLSLALAVIALIPTDDVIRSAGAMGIVMLGMSVVLVGIGYVVEKTSQTERAAGSLVKMVGILGGIVGSVVVLSMAILAIAAAGRIASSAKPEAFIAIGSVLLGLISVMVIVSALAGKFDKFSRGLTKVSMVISMLSTAFLALGAGIMLGILGLKMLSDFSGDQIERIGENLGELSQEMMRHADDIAVVIGTVVATIVDAIVRTLGASAITLVKDVLYIADEIVSAVFNKAPEIVNKLLAIILQILYGIESRIGEIVEVLVRIVYKAISALAKSIKEHQKEIVEAINSLIEAIIETFLRLIGRLFGITDEALDDFVGEWETAMKRIVLAVGGVWVVKTAIEALMGTVNTLSTLPSLFTTASKAILGFVNQVQNTMFLTGGGALTSIFKTLDARIIGTNSVLNKLGGSFFRTATIAVAAAFAIKGVIDALARNIEVTDEYTLKSSQYYSKQSGYLDQINQMTEARVKASAAAREELKDEETAVKTLKEIVGLDGKIVEGRELEVEELLPKLNAISKDTFKIEDGKLVRINEQNEAIAVQADELEDLYKKELLREQLERMREQRNKAKESLDSGEAVAELAEAKKSVEDAENEYGRLLFMQNQMQELLDTNPDEFYQRYTEWDMVNIRDKLQGQGEILTSARSALAAAYEKYETVQSIVQSYDEAEKAYLSGSAEDVELAINRLENGTIVSTNAIRLLADQYTKAIDDYNKKLDDYATAGLEMPEDLKKSLELKIEDTRKLLQDAGASIEGDLITFGDKLKLEYGFAGAYITEEDEKELLDKYKVLGWDAMTGFVGSLNDPEFSIRAGIAMDKLTTYLKENKLLEHSPSRLFAEMGEYCMIGFANGFEDETPNAMSSAATAALATVSAYQNAINNPSNQPVITPMYDTSALQNGSLMNGMSRQLNAGSVTARLAASVDTGAILEANDATVKELAGLREDVAGLKGVIGNLKVYMNGRALVGEIAPDMDQALGGITTAKRRGI